MKIHLIVLLLVVAPGTRDSRGEKAAEDSLPDGAIRVQVHSERDRVHLRFQVQLNPRLLSLGTPRLCLAAKKNSRVPVVARNPNGGWRALDASSGSAFSNLKRLGRKGELFESRSRLDEALLTGSDQCEFLIQIGLFEKKGGAFFLEPQTLRLVKREGLWTVESKAVGTLQPEPNPDLADRYGARLVPTGKIDTTATPSPIREVVMAGDGKFLVLRLADDPCIAIYDVAAGKIVRTLETGKANCRLAANRDHVFAAFGSPPQVLRWNMRTGEKRGSVTLTGATRVDAMAAGWRARDSPLVVVTDRQTLVLDPETLKPLEPTLPPYDSEIARTDAYQHHGRELLSGKLTHTLTASGDGREFVHHLGPRSKVSLRLRNGRVETLDILGAAGIGRLDARGDYLFHERGVAHLRQRHTPREARLTPHVEHEANGGVGPGMLVPIPSGDVFFQLRSGARDFEAPEVSLRGLDSRSQILLVFDGFQELTQRPVAGPAPAMRFWPFPALGRIVTIPADNRRIVSRKVDLAGALRRSGSSRQVITSSPRSTVRRGEVLAYRMKLLDSSRKPRSHLREGPDGARWSNASLTWPVPETRLVNRAEFRIAIGGDGARDHVFQIDVEGASPLAAGSRANKSDPEDRQGLATPTIEIETGKLSDEFAVGGAGRYLVYHTVDPPGLGVLDAEERQLIKHELLADADCRLAANHNSVFRLLPQQNLVERRRLPGLDARLVKAVPAGCELIAAGSHSKTADLILLGRKGIYRLDPETLESTAVDLKIDHAEVFGADWKLTGWARPALASSMDGKLFTSWWSGALKTPVRQLALDGVPAFSERSHRGRLTPGVGRHLLFGENGELFRRNGFEALRADGHQVGPALTVPGWDGDYFLSLELPCLPGSVGEKTTIQVYETTTVKEIIALAGFPEMDRDAEQLRDQDPRYRRFDPDRPPGGGFALEKRFHLLRSGTRLVTIPSGNDRLVLRTLDFERKLKALGRPFLYVKSAPPVTIQAGETYTWKPEIAASGGDPGIAPLDVPEGMEVTAERGVRWQVTPGQATGPVQVILELRDASGQTAYHSYTIHVLPSQKSSPDR